MELYFDEIGDFKKRTVMQKNEKVTWVVELLVVFSFHEVKLNCKARIIYKRIFRVSLDIFLPNNYLFSNLEVLNF